MNAVVKGVLGLLAMALGVSLAWWLSNRWDVAPQPVPTALALPVEAPPADGLLQVLERAPKLASELKTPQCAGLDCAAAWRKALPALQTTMQAQPAFGLACEAAAAKDRLVAAEALPERWSFDTPLPSYLPLSNCVRWAWSRAMVATEAGDLGAAIAALRQADRLTRSLQQDSRLLIGQMLAQNLLGRQLQLLVVIGEQRPEWRAQLLPFAKLDGASLLAGMRRWIPAEAAFGRGAVDSMRSGTQSTSAPRESAWRLLEPSTQPEYTKQLMSTHWLRVLEALDGDDPQAALARMQAVLEPEAGWFGTSFHWFHTLPRFLHEVALPGYASYFQRPADLQLAAEATQLWLNGGRPEQAQGALRERLGQESNGSWRLRLHKADPDPRMPTHWPALN